MRRFGLISLVVVTFVGMAAAQQPAAVIPNHHEVKYVIFMVPDGMGLSDVTAVRIQKNGINGAPLWLETLEHIGYQRTYSEKNTVTDSSAAASAWACGEKFVNNEVCFHTDGRPYNPSLLELAQLRGLATGLVATQTVTHATPAAFASHPSARACEQEIARQYVQVTQPDLMLGGGRSKFISMVTDSCGTAGDFAAQAVAHGYRYVTTKTELEAAVAAGDRKLLGLFASSNLTPEYLRTSTPSAATQPRLPEMTTAALSVLEKNPAGFFVMIEGSLIDSGNHDENLPYQYGELSAFDEAVKEVLGWIDASPERREHTLLVIAPDHETGGFGVKGTEKPGGEPLGYFYAGWTFPPIDPNIPDLKEAHHTGGDVMIWSQGPGSEALGRAIDNTFVYEVVKSALKL